MEGLFSLVMSILCSCCLVLYFKFVEKQRFPLLPVIVVNYITCVCMGGWQAPDFFTHIAATPQSPLPVAIILGLLCIGIFFLIGMLTQKVGAGFVAILTKMCVIIPIIFAWVFLSESLTAWKVAGILCALVALYLIQLPAHSSQSDILRNWLPALLVFLGSGAIETLLKVADVYYIPYLPSPTYFLILMLGTASIVGLGIALIEMARGNTAYYNYKAWLAGIGLGIPNFGSFYFLLSALSKMPATFFFPVNNVMIVVVLCILGILFFHEKYTKWNYAGIGIALGAIVLMAI